jgi:hypothetical protein
VSSIRFGPTRLRINSVRTRKYALDWVEENHVAPLAREILIDARARAQRRTGYMRSQLRVWSKRRLGSNLVYRVGTPAPYALFPHSGTRPHDIDPRKVNGRLVFFWAKVGRIVSLRHVNHPGSKGSFFLTGPLFARGIPRGFRVTVRITFGGRLI